MTDFRQDKAIYLQIAESISDKILSGVYAPESRIPSVRELAVMLEVNTNTVVKTYDILQREEIIYTRRGLGYFVTPDARQKIQQTRRERLMNEDLPELFRQMTLLDIPIGAITSRWEEFQM